MGNPNTLPSALIVEDDRNVRRLVSRVIKRALGEDIDIIEACTLPEALEWVLKNQGKALSCAVVDGNFPRGDLVLEQGELSGMCVVKALLKNGCPPDRIVVSSGDGVMQEWAEINGITRLDKPYSVSEFIVQIKTVVQEKLEEAFPKIMSGSGDNDLSENDVSTPEQGENAAPPLNINWRPGGLSTGRANGFRLPGKK